MITSGILVTRLAGSDGTTRCPDAVAMYKRSDQCRCLFKYYYLSWLSFSYKMVKILSVCFWMCVWMLTRLEQILTTAHRDL